MEATQSNDISTLWRQILCFLRSQGQSHHQAEDLTQEVFRLLIEKNLLDQANSRPFVFAIARNVLVSQLRRQRAAKRGGQASVVSFDDGIQEPCALGHTQTPADEAMQNEMRSQWERHLAMIEWDAKQKGKHALFLCLRGSLEPERDTSTFQSTTAALGLNPATVRVQAHRWRRQLMDRMRSDIIADEAA